MKRNKWPYLFCAPFLLAYALFMVFPMCYSFYLSLYDYNGIVEKHYVGFANYVTIDRKGYPKGDGGGIGVVLGL